MSKDLREKVFPLSLEKEDWDLCRQEWSGEYYTQESAKCVCGVRIVEQYLIKNRMTGCELIVGNVCIKQFKELLEWADSERKLKQCYSVTGKFQKRNYGKNSYKVRKNTKLTKLLSNLESKGYKVPMYGYKYLYISVTESLTREALKDYKLQLKLSEYENQSTKMLGIVLEPTTTTETLRTTKKRKINVI
jgi:hypothetical protein